MGLTQLAGQKTGWLFPATDLANRPPKYAICQPLGCGSKPRKPLVNIKIAGTWVFIRPRLKIRQQGQTAGFGTHVSTSQCNPCWVPLFFFFAPGPNGSAEVFRPMAQVRRSRPGPSPQISTLRTAGLPGFRALQSFLKPCRQAPCFALDASSAASDFAGCWGLQLPQKGSLNRGA